MQHNKGRIAVNSDEEEDIQEEDTQEKDKERMKQESTHGEELKTEIISMAKNLKQKNISGEALKKQKSIHGEELITEQYA